MSVQSVLRLSVTSLLLTIVAICVQAEEESEPTIIKSHAFAAIGEPKYGADFKHFDYVNPDAPRGGRLVLANIGTYDSFNRYASRGDAPVSAYDLTDDRLYDTLMIASQDEVDVYYPLIAESLEYPENYAWVIFNINPKARAIDGEPITAEDVAFSFNKFMEQGVSQFRTYFKGVTQAEVLSEHRVKFHFDAPNRDYAASLVALTILPKHYWKDRNFSEPLEKPPVGSGAYRVKAYKMGQELTYERLSDYWAKDLPSRVGTHNFDIVHYDFYRDSTVALEAFKAGEYDFRQEGEAKKWTEDYNISAVKRGHIVKEELDHNEPQAMKAYVFNTQREIFQDRKVRQALNYALDFEWMNKNLFYNQYERTHSYFQNTPYAATGTPSEQELEILEPFRDQLPDATFGEVWRPNTTDGSGNIRPALREAMKLLKDAGWELKDRKLVHSKTGKPFEFELLFYQPSSERVALPFKRNLERLGIDVKLRQVDSSQYLNRLRSRDFDMTDQGYRANAYPQTVMKITWHSDYMDSTYNQAGVEDPVIDSLIEQIEKNQENPEKLTALGKAFDRVALWNFYVIPHWYSGHYRVAYWNKFSRPEKRPNYDLGLNTWWYDTDKAKTLSR